MRARAHPFFTVNVIDRRRLTTEPRAWTRAQGAIIRISFTIAVRRME
ncbi:hypothetical protein A33M_1930 [Rhodovulum sp. PH10]|nr:hypothetical protein A33M_1930 [Rhodovulum sp. PH10]